MTVSSEIIAARLFLLNKDLVLFTPGIIFIARAGHSDVIRFPFFHILDQTHIVAFIYAAFFAHHSPAAVHQGSIEPCANFDVLDNHPVFPGGGRYEFKVVSVQPEIALPVTVLSYCHDRRVAQGISFLSGLAQTLQSPEATQQLVDTLVETNAETGESHLRIPVPDKQTVQTLLNFVGKLFSNNS